MPNYMSRNFQEGRNKMNNKILTLDNEYIRLANVASCLYYADKLQDKKLIGLCFKNLMELGVTYEFSADKKKISLNIDETYYEYDSDILKSCYTEKELEYLMETTTSMQMGGTIEIEVEDADDNADAVKTAPFSFFEFKEESNMEKDNVIEEPFVSVDKDSVLETKEEPVEEKPIAPPNWGRRSVIESYEEQLIIERELQKEKEALEEKQTKIKPLENVPFFIPTTQMHKEELFFSMFRGVLREEGSLLSEEIYFMVYPLMIEKDNASTNIVCYAFSKNENYCQTSLDNEIKNSLIMKVGCYEFLVRGRFDDYKWTSSIVTTGSTIKQNISFEIIGEYHSSPFVFDEDNLPNGHIKFKYVGYVNHKDELTEALIEVFPTDLMEDAFLVIRRIEDFIDVYYTDKVPLILIQTENGMAELKCYWENMKINAELIEN